MSTFSADPQMGLEDILQTTPNTLTHPHTHPHTHEGLSAFVTQGLSWVLSKTLRLLTHLIPASRDQNQSTDPSTLPKSRAVPSPVHGAQGR